MVEFEFEKKPKFLEVETGHVYFDTDKTPFENPFSKNVTVDAHTEYTAIKNGRLCGDGGSNAYLIELNLIGESTLETDASFEEAKKCFQSGGKVLFLMGEGNMEDMSIWYQITEYVENYEDTGCEALITSSERSMTGFLSDGTITYVIPTNGSGPNATPAPNPIDPIEP